MKPTCLTKCISFRKKLILTETCWPIPQIVVLCNCSTLVECPLDQVVSGHKLKWVTPVETCATLVMDSLTESWYFRSNIPFGFKWTTGEATRQPQSLTTCDANSYFFHETLSPGYKQIDISGKSSHHGWLLLQNSIPFRVELEAIFFLNFRLHFPPGNWTKMPPNCFPWFDLIDRWTWVNINCSS